MEALKPESAQTLTTAPDVRRIPHGTVTVQYQKKDITAAITPYLIDVTYTDRSDGESDSVEITVEDTDRRWQNAWYPTHGDTLTVAIGYAGETLLPCGVFEIDEIELDGPPDQVRIKALGAGVKRPVRTRNGRAYENTTLADIAATVARRNKLHLKGKIETIRITRVTQAFENDLSFLARVAKEYGYQFSVRGADLTFYKRADLKADKVVKTINRTDVSRYRFHDKVHQIYVASTVSWHDPHAKRTRKKRVKASSSPLSVYDHYSADELNLNVRAENDTQAHLKAQAALERANDDQTGADLTLVGDTKLAAGVNVQVLGFGKMNGKYHITQSTHRFSRNTGYTTNIELKRVREAENGG
ncbi:MAG: contractile injection system protein, VgrG/Pvc8 family [Burkholderia gladioli]